MNINCITYKVTFTHSFHFNLLFISKIDFHFYLSLITYQEKIIIFSIFILNIKYLFPKSFDRNNLAKYLYQ